MINKKFLILVGFISLIMTSAFAQENKRSEEIKWINGEKFYIHTVTQGQGLFSIKKLYHVEEKDILENNPEVFDGLKLGQQIKIPFVKEPEVALPYKIHEIQPGETIYSISKLYGVSQEGIFALNPETKEGYKIYQKIKIPDQLESSDDEETDEISSDGKTYKVKRKDTLYALAKKFEVSQEALMAANPIIKEEGLKKGQILNIPEKEIIIKEALYMPLDTMFYDESSLLDGNIACDSIVNRFVPMNVALMLPFEIDKMVFDQELESRSSQKPQFSEKPFIQFYQAFLIAVQNLKAEGYKLNIHVFNTKKDTNEVKRILKKGIFQDVDLIIGPVYTENFRLVQKLSDSLHIPIINPIIKETDVVNFGAFTMDVFPSEKMIMYQSVNLLLHNDTSEIFIIHSGFVDDLQKLSAFKKDYREALLKSGKDTTFKFKELVFSDSKKINIKPFLNKTKSNFVLIISDNQAFVSNIFTHLNILSKNIDIQVLARPKWQKFDNIDLTYFHNLNVLQLTNEYVDYNQPKVIDFLINYREYYNLEPSKYAFYAYDITYNFTKYFYKHSSFKCLREFQYDGLIFDFDMVKVKKGWMNRNLFVLHYQKDFVLTKRYQINKQLIKLEQE